MNMKTVRDEGHNNSACVQTDTIPHAHASVQYRDGMMVKQEALTRLHMIMNRNSNVYHYDRLYDILMVSLRNTKGRLRSTLEEKMVFTRKRETSEEVVASHRYSMICVWMNSVHIVMNDSMLHNKYVAMSKMHTNSIVYGKRMRHLKRCVDIHVSYVSHILYDVIKTVRDKTIPTYISKYYRMSILIDNVFVRKSSIYKSYTIEIIINNTKHDAKNVLNSINNSMVNSSINNKRNAFAKSRMTGSFIVSRANDFSDGSDKILSLFENTMRSTFRYTSIT